MPFDLCNAPAIFQRLMDEILAPYWRKFVEVYLDDITIFSKTFKDHCKHVFIILNTFKQTFLKLNLKNTIFFFQVKLIGYEINREDIQPDDEKLNKVYNYSQLTTIR